MTDLIKSADFTALTTTPGKAVLIDVYADWCGPCKAIAPVINALADELAGVVHVVKMDRDEAAANDHGGTNPLLKFMTDHGVRGIPALLLFDDGAFKGVLVGGPRPRGNIVEWMEKTLGRPVAAVSPAKPAPSAPQP